MSSGGEPVVPNPEPLILLAVAFGGMLALGLTMGAQARGYFRETLPKVREATAKRQVLDSRERSHKEQLRRMKEGFQMEPNLLQIRKLRLLVGEVLIPVLACLVLALGLLLIFSPPWSPADLTPAIIAIYSATSLGLALTFALSLALHVKASRIETELEGLIWDREVPA